jgi:hypothetical protein
VDQVIKADTITVEAGSINYRHQLHHRGNSQCSISQLLPAAKTNAAPSITTPQGIQWLHHGSGGFLIPQ